MKTKQDWMDYALELEAAIRAVTHRHGDGVYASYKDHVNLLDHASILENAWDNAPKEEDPGIQANMATPFAENH